MRQPRRATFSATVPTSLFTNEDLPSAACIASRLRCLPFAKATRRWTKPSASAAGGPGHAGRAPVATGG